MGYVTLFYVLGNDYLGVWSPAAMTQYSNAYSTYLPWIYPLLTGLVAATMEEFLFRLVAISLLLRWFKKSWLALLVSAAVWAFLHADYPQEPIYIRGLELTIVGILLGMVFLRFGVWATIISHYVYNCFLGVYHMVQSDSLYFKISGILAVAIISIPALPAIWSAVRGRYEDALPEPAPEAPKAAPPPSGLPAEPPEPQIKRKRPSDYLISGKGLLVFGLLGLLGWSVYFIYEPRDFAEYAREKVPTRAQAIEIAEGIRGQLGLDLEGYRRTTSFSSSLGSNHFLNSPCKCNRFGSWHRKGQLVYFPWPLQTQLPTEALMGTYHQLTEHQRYQIYALKKAGHDQQSIAATVSVSPSTIGRELQRNRGQRGYRPGQAHQQALARRRHKAKATKMTAAVIERIEADLGQEWSPEQIAGRLAATDGLRLSPQRIYQHIQADRQAGGTLYRHLRHSQKKRKKRDGKADARGPIKGRVSMDQRPALVEEKSRIGDWEIDLVMGRARTGALVSVVERRSRYTVLGKVPSKHAEQVAATTIGLLAPHKGHTQPITADNGKEFAHHTTISQALDAAVYFARSLSCLGAGTQREYQWADSPVCAQRHGLGYAVPGTDTPHHGSAQSSAAKGLGFSNAP